jgi:hypothetical protein
VGRSQGTGRLLAAVLVSLAAVPAARAAVPYAPVAHNPADRLASRPIDPYRYDRATRCRRHPSAGALALAGWLDGHVRGSSWGIMRCERLGDGYSLHSEGRAVDWHLDAAVPADRRAARRLIELLLAPTAPATRTPWPAGWACRS